MSEDFSDILDDNAAERSEFEPLIHMLRSNRPVPRAAFRGQLARQLRAAPVHRPLRLLWLRVATLAVAGALMLGLVALGVNHHGPFAPSRTAQSQAQIQKHAVVALTSRLHRG